MVDLSSYWTFGLTFIYYDASIYDNLSDPAKLIRKEIKIIFRDNFIPEDRWMAYFRSMSSITYASTSILSFF